MCLAAAAAPALPLCSGFFDRPLRPRPALAQISALQNALEDAKLALYDERAALLTLQAENDDLKAQEVEDRVRVQQLLAMTGPHAAGGAAAAAGGGRRGADAAAPPAAAAGGGGGAPAAALRRQLDDVRRLADERAAAYARDRAAARDAAERRAAADAAANAVLDAGLRAAQLKVAEMTRGALSTFSAPAGGSARGARARGP